MPCALLQNSTIHSDYRSVNNVLAGLLAFTKYAHQVSGPSANVLGHLVVSVYARQLVPVHAEFLQYFLNSRTTFDQLMMRNQRVLGDIYQKI